MTSETAHIAAENQSANVPRIVVQQAGARLNAIGQSAIHHQFSIEPIAVSVGAPFRAELRERLQHKQLATQRQQSPIRERKLAIQILRVNLRTRACERAAAQGQMHRNRREHEHDFCELGRRALQLLRLLFFGSRQRHDGRR